jgi:hypothetical protein
MYAAESALAMLSGAGPPRTTIGGDTLPNNAAELRQPV